MKKLSTILKNVLFLIKISIPDVRSTAKAAEVTEEIAKNADATEEECSGHNFYPKNG
jgi:hypothetical protein